jgi:hypothetical protein
MNTPFLIGAVVGMCSLNLAVAAPIVWQTAEDTADPTAVATDGELVEAINGSAAAGVATVNGVTFSPSNALLSNNAATNMLDGGQTLDPGLDALLNSLDFGGGTATAIAVGSGALVVGQSYNIQVFFTDLRSCCRGRVMTFGDGLGGDVDVNASGGAGAFGQNSIGTFVADGTSQTLSITTANAGNVHINAYQIRSAFPVPVIESFTTTPALIASGESSTLNWQISAADTARIDVGIGAVDAAAGSASASPTDTTTYTLTATNGGGSVSAQVTVGVDVPMLDPVLNEFLASNDTGLVDNNGSYSDWIEIHNPNAFEIDLGGYYLADTPSTATWAFPAGTSLAGDGYLIVFASGVGSQTQPFHTDFKISTSPSYLALVAPDGSTVIDEFVDYPPQRTDVSYGVAGYFSPPTPGEANGTVFAGFVEDTAFDIDRGFYDAPITVNITTPTPDATIVYTTDGTEPTFTNGTQGSSVAISSTTVLRAAAFKTGLAPTNVDTQTYLFPADVIEQSNMDPEVVDDLAYADEMIPALKSVRSLSIVTAPDNLFSGATGILENTGGRGIAWEREVSIEFLDPDNPMASFQTGAGLRMHGNGSRGSAKNSLRLLFRADYGAKKLNYPLFGEDWVAQKFNTIVLRAQAANSWLSSRSEDRDSTTYLQDSFAKDTQGAMGHPTAGSTFVHLYLNGTYWGLYNPTERPDGSFGEVHFGGDDTDYDAVNRRFTVEVLSGTKTHWDAMIAHSNTLLDTQVEYELMGDYMDLDNLIDYMLVHQYMQTRDGPDDFGHNNMRLVRRNNPPGPWRAYAWDMEYSMIDTTGTRDYSYPFPTYSSSRSGARDITDSIASIYLRLKDNNPEFQLRYADRAYKHLYNGGALTEQSAAARFEARAMEIESAVIAESARWGDHRRAAPYTRDGEWTTERKRLLTEFFPARPDHVVSQLRIHGLYPSIDPPAFTRNADEVAIAAAAGTIYYTTDGSDPREAWTDTALGTAYAAPIDLTGSLTIKARTLNNGEWSALAEEQFLVGPLADASNLVISEIHYQPAGSGEALEFLELTNISADEIDLSGVEFSAGIDFAFALGTRLAAGERILIVNSIAFFEAEHGAALPIAGEFQNLTKLSNSGEQIALLAADGSAIRDFRYRDDLPWPTAADGLGYSLVLINAATNPDHALPSSWRSSVAVGGNPGTIDAVPFTGIGTDSMELATDGTFVTIAYTHELGADDVALSLEWSADLQTWSPLGNAFELSTLTTIVGGRQRVELTSLPAVLDHGGRIFFRLVVEGSADL